MHNQSHNQPHPDDQEAAMARADLYKLANYSMKLFKMIHDGDELEGWVQAKITKAADYVASVYHYMEYEMKFSEYGDKLENSDMYGESVRDQFAAKLMEARTKLDKLKKMNEEDLKKTGDTKKTSKGGTVTKTDKGIKHERDPKSYSDEDGDEKSGKGTKSHAKSQSAAEKKAKAPAQKQSPKSAKTWGMKDSAKFDNRDKVKEGMAPTNPDGATAAPKKGKDGQYPMVTSGPHKGKRWSPNTPGPTNPAMKEGAKPDFLDMDKDGDKKEPMKKAVADKKAGPKKGVNPFAKVKESAKPDFLDMDKDGDKKEPMKKAVADKKVSEKFDPLKHVKNPTKGEKTAAKDVKRGSYADRAAMLKSAEKDGRLKEHAEVAASAVLAKLRG